MSAIMFAAYWRDDTKDVGLGDFYLDVPPSIGTLLALSTEEAPHVSWRVVEVQMVPAATGSMKARNLGGPYAAEQMGMYFVFVEPAPGPFRDWEDIVPAEMAS